MSDKRPVPAFRPNQDLSNLVLEGGRKQSYDDIIDEVRDRVERRTERENGRSTRSLWSRLLWWL